MYNKTWLTSSHCHPGNTAKNRYTVGATLHQWMPQEGHAQKIHAHVPAPCVQIN